MYLECQSYEIQRCLSCCLKIGIHYGRVIADVIGVNKPKSLLLVDEVNIIINNNSWLTNLLKSKQLEKSVQIERSQSKEQRYYQNLIACQDQQKKQQTIFVLVSID
ncbi:unnamed protein product [Paramecium sonneborni]|uniref:Guanylate cyclase domain-containing protein n=1 Tax=Paramecium sonneborni TaxID=65129 RepID=A0A8S1K163_9CILI|nr:unnamed protein product [Paramecium sonneborni]